uniref:NADH-ubiquinone oxidoreductase chain 5 n=1 Tax=Phaeophyceae sp. TaxID=2249243 RepID=A0A8E8PF72_9PHAE|nr:Nad5 [Phaeophyceae sp.]
MYLNILLLPLIGSLLSGVFGTCYGGRGAGILAITCMCLSSLVSALAFYEVGFAGSAAYMYLMPWLDSGSFHVDWGFCFDSLTVVMLVVITFISTLVHIYSTEYMVSDPHLPRFMSYLSLFTFFMLLLVTADNFIQMFVGWEGVGLCSYLLINFWFSRVQANKSAMKAMLINRIGDFGLVLGIFGIYFTFGTLDYSTVFSLAPQLSGYTISFLSVELGALNLIGILLFIGAVGKSAQLGLHTWLPDAMEGPTPVSALIHAATMVTAGVFLLARCSPLLEYSPEALSIVSCVGGMSAFFAATTALVQNDLKRVIAYSTCSQLGYMVFSCGLSNYSVAVFHLFNHAFFKALLFLGAGSVIHAVGDEQDMRKMGGLRRLLPFTYAMMAVGSLSLMGMPFLTGFYSKDIVLEVAYATYSTRAHFAYFLGAFGAFCTAFYSFRLLYLCFLSEPRGSRVGLLPAAEGGWAISLSLGLLAIPSIFIGYLARDLFIGLGSDFWGNSIFSLPTNSVLIDGEYMPLHIKMLPLLMSISGLLLGFYLYSFSKRALYTFFRTTRSRKIYTFLNRRWFFDKVYNSILTQNILDMGYLFTYKDIDRGLVESVGPLGLSQAIQDQSEQIRRWHSGYLYHYIVAFIWGSFLSYIVTLSILPSPHLVVLLLLSQLCL